MEGGSENSPNHQINNSSDMPDVDANVESNINQSEVYNQSITQETHEIENEIAPIENQEMQFQQLR